MVIAEYTHYCCLLSFSFIALSFLQKIHGAGGRCCCYWHFGGGLEGCRNPRTSRRSLERHNQIRCCCPLGAQHFKNHLSSITGIICNLGAAPRRRRQLIQIDQLITILTDGVLLFSELEALVIRLDNPDFALPNRMQWAWNDKEFAKHISRLQYFKSSISVMLNILQW